VRVKEFLSELGIDYESINVSAQPEAMEALLELGVRTVPVVSRGRDYVFGQELADVSRFVGREVQFSRLPAATLVARWVDLLEAAQRHVLQIPAERFPERATSGRDRSIRELAYHVYQVPEAFLDAVENGVQDLAVRYNAPPPPQVTSAEDIRQYGVRVAARLARWWAGLEDRSCAGELQTYYGRQPMHHVLERCTWHSAQHVRQIAALLEEFGIEPDPPLTKAHYAGLPLPSGLWE
jgi:uncharacterized damage-inducible protein DinB